jgi:hypothetical protein
MMVQDYLAANPTCGPHLFHQRLVLIKLLVVAQNMYLYVLIVVFSDIG